MPRTPVYPPNPSDVLRRRVLELVARGADPATGTFTARPTSDGGTTYQLTIAGDVRVTATARPRIVTVHEVTVEEWDGQGWADSGAGLHGLRARSVARAMAAALSQRTAARLAATAAALS